MPTCIYCNKEKHENEFSLEHIIPQFLGGKYAPDIFKTRQVCKKCNNDLGLFVDAAFAKNWLVSNWLQGFDLAYFDPKHPTPASLMCMGEIDLKPPRMKPNELCESWLGPFGEQIYLIRQRDERMHWYVGGNPRTAKQEQSRAYFLFSKNSTKNIQLAWLSFQEAFSDKKVKKIMCTSVSGANVQDIGFSLPDEIDEERISFFNHACVGEHTRHGQFSMFIHYDFRFMAKLALGVSYSLFGKDVLYTSYTNELRRAIWYNKDSGEAKPKIIGTPAFGKNMDNSPLSQLGEEDAVTISIFPSQNAQIVALNLNIGKQHNWMIGCAHYSDLTISQIDSLDDGATLILYKTLKKNIFLPYLEYIAHQTGNIPNTDIQSIQNIRKNAKEYFKSLHKNEALR